MRRPRDVIALPNRVVRGWWRKEVTGAYRQMRPDPGALEALRARGVDVEVLPTAKPSGATHSSIRASRRRRCT